MVISWLQRSLLRTVVSLKHDTLRSSIATISCYWKEKNLSPKCCFASISIRFLSTLCEQRIYIYTYPLYTLWYERINIILIYIYKIAILHHGMQSFRINRLLHACRLLHDCWRHSAHWFVTSRLYPAWVFNITTRAWN